MRLAVLALVLMLFACGAGHDAPPSPKAYGIDRAYAANSPLIPDPNVRTGRLSNGLSYFIMPNHRPAARAQMWLAVNAGAVQEDEDQHGLAHFVEHMCFNGTRRFPKHDIIDLVEQSGMRFGGDLNASTSADETIYKLQLPTDRMGLTSKALMVLRDFADGVTFDPKEIEAERGVVLEEWRLRRGPGARIDEKHAESLSNPSRYAGHRPIGNPETIKGAPASVIQRFYRDWYRPDLMAVVAVGDFSADDIEEKIKSEFASLKNPAPERAKIPIQIHFPEQTAFSIDTDPELPNGRVEIDNLLPHRPLATVGDYRRVVVEELWNAMLNARLDELSRSPDAPFLSARSSASQPNRMSDQFREVAVVHQDGVKDAISALFRELLRVERHGFTATELGRAKAAAFRAAARRAAQIADRDSLSLVNSLVRGFLSGHVVQAPVTEVAQMQQFLPQVDRAEVNAVSALFAKGRHVTVAGPPSMAKPPEEALRIAVRDVALSKIPAYQDAGAGAKLMANAPAPGRVVSTTEVREIGALEWRLKNGARVIVKPTGAEPDRIRMSVFAPGGTSLASDADFDSARFASEIVAQSGVGTLDETTLKKALAGTLVQVDPFIEELQEGVRGTSSVDDLETMLQLTSLMFTAPRRDQTAFDAWRARSIESIKTRELSPEAAFAEELAKLATRDSPRRRSPTAESYQRATLDRAISFYRERFADAGNFTFLFIGDIDPAPLKPLVETYIGSLPSTHRRETWRDLNVTIPPGVIRAVVTLPSSEPRSNVSLTFHGGETWSATAQSDIATLSEVFGHRLRDVLREEMGGTYTVSVRGAIERRPRQEFTVNVFFVCAPENVDRMVKAVLDEAAHLREKTIDVDLIRGAREGRKRGYETAVADDSFWLRRLETIYTFGDEPKPAEISPPMTVERVKAAAQRYLLPNQYMLGILNPQK